MVVIDPKVLLVDDEPDIRLVVQTLLEGPEWSFQEASSGEEALARVDEDVFDIVVLDYRMPGLTGIDVARHLRDNGHDLPIILFSAYLSPELEEEAKTLDVPTVDKADLLLLIDRIRELTRH